MSDALVHDVLGQLGRRKRADDRLTLTGSNDPVFVTPWRIAETGSAALGAIGLAVSDLWRLRTGKPQAVTIDRRAAAASLRSNTYVRRNGEKPVSWDPLAGHYPTRDGSPSRRLSRQAIASAASCAAATNGTPTRTESPSPSCR